MRHLVHLATASGALAFAAGLWATALTPGERGKPEGYLDEPVLPFVRQAEAAEVARPMSLYERLLRWNGEVLWAPATASSDPVTKFGDEARSVFGPMPDGVCTGPASRQLGLEVDGNVVKLEPNPSKTGSPLEFAHRDVNGRLVKWTTEINRCDKPSLAGGVTFCAMNSRIGFVKRNHVQWLFLCRKSTDSPEIKPDSYWTATDPRFSRYSAIGFNDVTGEIAFLDGRKDRSVFDWRERFPPPGGRSYGDKAGRREAEDLYDGGFAVNCALCHDNKKPAVVDPHMQQARVGYLEGRNDPRAAFGLGNFLPGRIARPDAPFRVVGSGFMDAHGGTLAEARAFMIKDHSCSGCHSLTTLESGRRLAADAVGRKPFVQNPTVPLNSVLFAQNVALGLVNNHKTEWASASGAGRISPWMTPDHGGNLSKNSQNFDDDDWSRLSRCAWGVGGSECGYKPLFTACPAPGSGGDTFVPMNFSTEVLSEPTSDETKAKKLRVSWKYLNAYGDVPERDDVRFNVAFRQTDMPPGESSPKPQDYPTVREANGADFVAVVGEIGGSGSAALLKDVSFLGHKKWTDPPPSDVARFYSIDVPAICGTRYLFRILPKRFCFDNSGIRYSEADYLLYKDIDCGR